MSQVTRDYIDDLLPGYRFCPTDLELIVNYLQQKIGSRKLENCRIHEVYLYDYTPEELAEKHRSCENVWYFLTSRDRICPKGNRPKRTTKNYGFWKTTQAKSEVYDGRVQLVGYKRSLKFHEENKDKTEWLMHEYTTNDPNLPVGTNGNKLNDWVLCKIYKKEVSQNAKANHVQAHDKPSLKRKRLSVNNQGINQQNCSEPQHVQVQDATHYHSGTHVQMAEPVQSVIISNQQLANNIDTSTFASSSTSPIESPTTVAASSQPISTPQLDCDLPTREEFAEYFDVNAFLDEFNCPIWGQVYH